MGMLLRELFISRRTVCGARKWWRGVGVPHGRLTCYSNRHSYECCPWQRIPSRHPVCRHEGPDYVQTICRYTTAGYTWACSEALQPASATLIAHNCTSAPLSRSFPQHSSQLFVQHVCTSAPAQIGASCKGCVLPPTYHPSCSPCPTFADPPPPLHSLLPLLPHPAPPSQAAAAAAGEERVRRHHRLRPLRHAAAGGHGGGAGAARRALSGGAGGGWQGAAGGGAAGAGAARGAGHGGRWAGGGWVVQGPSMSS